MKPELLMFTKDELIQFLVKNVGLVVSHHYNARIEDVDYREFRAIAAFLVEKKVMEGVRNE